MYFHEELLHKDEEENDYVLYHSLQGDDAEERELCFLLQHTTWFKPSDLIMKKWLWVSKFWASQVTQDVSKSLNTHACKVLIGESWRVCTFGDKSDNAQVL